MVNYPRGIFSSIEHSISHQNKIIFSDRGMTLEQQINESNEYYLNHNIAVIHKKPTPIQIVKVDYPRRSRAVIKEAYFRQAAFLFSLDSRLEYLRFRGVGNGLSHLSGFVS